MASGFTSIQRFVRSQTNGDMRIVAQGDQLLSKRGLILRADISHRFDADLPRRIAQCLGHPGSCAGIAEAPQGAGRHGANPPHRVVEEGEERIHRSRIPGVTQGPSSISAHSPVSIVKRIHERFDDPAIVNERQGPAGAVGDEIVGAAGVPASRVY